MGKKRLIAKLLTGFVAFSLITTSWGGAFATAVLAATPDVTTQQVDTSNNSSSGKNVLGGLIALGLIAMLAKGGDKASNTTSPDKTTTPASQPTSTPSTQSKPTTQTTNTTTQQTPQPVAKPASQPASKSASTSTPGGLTADEQNAFNLLNADRAANGLPPVRVNLKLTGLAENYAQDMINRGFFSHTNPEGQSPFDRMRQYGISYGYAGENLAINTSVPNAEKAFMNSPGHRANILNSHYTQVGLGVRYSPSGSVYVVQEFTDG